jgi:ParB/RepB/Spo0J family partition protein
MGKHVLTGVEGLVKRGEFFFVEPRVLAVEEGFNKREAIGDEEDHDLKKSIIENGVQVPLKVQKVKVWGGERLFVREGHRRLWACMQALNEGFDPGPVPVQVIDRNTKEPDALFLSLTCNTGRPFTALEEAAAFEALVRHGVEVAEIARRTGRSLVYVYERLKLNHLAPEVEAKLRAGEITIRDAANAAGRNKDNAEKQIEATSRPKPKTIAIKWGKRDHSFVARNKTGDPGYSEIDPTWLLRDVIDKCEALGLNPASIKFSVRPKTEKNETQEQKCLDFMSRTGSQDRSGPEDIND